MAELAVDFIDFLDSDATIAGYVVSGGVTRIYQNHVSQDKSKPYIWFQQSGIEYSEVIAPANGVAPLFESFDVECWATDVDTAALLGKAVRDRCAFFRGTLGTRSVGGVFVDDQDDNYLAKGNGNDEGLHVVALSVRINSRQ